MFEEYRVEADSVAEFLERYYRPDRYHGRGEEYAAVLLASHEKDYRTKGFDIISHHDSATGRVVAIFADLHVYTNGPDFVVAIDEVQARELLTEFASEWEEGDGEMPVTLLADDNYQVIHFEDELKDYPDGSIFLDVDHSAVKATAKAWANWNKVGFLATINY